MSVIYALTATKCFQINVNTIKMLIIKRGVATNNYCLCTTIAIQSDLIVYSLSPKLCIWTIKSVVLDHASSNGNYMSTRCFAVFYNHDILRIRGFIKFYKFSLIFWNLYKNGSCYKRKIFALKRKNFSDQFNSIQFGWNVVYRM